MFLNVSSDVIFCGDLNYPSSNNNRVSGRLEDSLISADFVQHVHEPTRGNNLLDIFATSDPDLVSSVRFVDSCSVSDHKLVITAINVDPVKSDSIRQTFRNLKSFDASPVTPAEVSQLLHSLQPKSSNLDFIPTSLIKAFFSTFSSLIAHLANLSFNQGVFPSHLKIAQITPLIKKPKLNRDYPSNYRPISNLNNISKILERLFLARLQPHLINSPHYNPFQSTYRSCHSTETALLTLLNKTRLSADQGNPRSYSVTRPERCLRHHRSRDPTRSTSLNVWCWWNCSELASFLSNPTVPICEDRPGYIFIRLTQCSTGFRTWSDPFHFLHLPHSICCRPFQGWSATIRGWHPVLLHLTFWFYYNCLALNPEKSEAILLGTHARNKSLSNINQVDIAGSPIPLSDKIKLLGVTIDSTLNFSKHVSLICQSCQYYIRALRHIRPILDAHTARLIGHALVSSWLDYTNSVILYGLPKSQIAKLQSQQNALARVVMRASFGSARPLLHELHWLPVASIGSSSKLQPSPTLYKILDSGLPSYLPSQLSHYHPARELRSSSSNLLAQPYSNTNFGSLAFQSSAPKIWNKLPLEVKSAHSLQTFKSRHKTHYFSKPLA